MKTFYDLMIEYDEFIKTFTTTIIKDQNPENIKSQYKKMTDTFRKLGNQLNNTKEYKEIKNKLKSQEKFLEAYKAKIPVIEALCVEGLRDRHIKRINKLLNIDIDVLSSKWPDLGNPENYKDQLEVIADEATKEFSIEKTMASMKADWKKLAFTTKPHKTSGYILDGQAVEEL